MNFGEAIEILKRGGRVAREGWNGKGMHIYLRVFEDPCKFEPVIVMYTAQNKRQPGWLASQADILAEDWEQVGEPA